MGPGASSEGLPRPCSDLWQVLTIEAGTVVTREPACRDGGLLLPSLHQGPGVENELSGFVRSLFPYPSIPVALSFSWSKRFQGLFIPAVLKSKHKVMNFGGSPHRSAQPD